MRFRFLAICIFALCCAIAKADSFTVYDFQNVIAPVAMSTPPLAPPPSFLAATGANLTVTGSITLDTTTNVVTFGDFTVHGLQLGDVFFDGSPHYSLPTTTHCCNSHGDSFTGAPISFTSFTASLPGYPQDSLELSLYFALTSFDGTGALRICSWSFSDCQEPAGSQLYARTNDAGSVFNGGIAFPQSGGSLVPEAPTSVTPEPSSLMLLGTGVLGAAGVLRRRVATPGISLKG